MKNLSGVMTPENIRLVALVLNAPQNPKSDNVALSVGTAPYIKGVFVSAFLPDSEASYTAADTAVLNIINAQITAAGRFSQIGGLCESRFDSNCLAEANGGSQEPLTAPVRSGHILGACDRILGGTAPSRGLTNILAKNGHTPASPLTAQIVSDLYSIFYPGRILPATVANTIRERFDAPSVTIQVKHTMLANLMCSSLAWEAL
jgi:hypothetical protein